MVEHFYGNFDRLGISKKNKSTLRKLRIDYIDSLLKYPKEMIEKNLEKVPLEFANDFFSFYEQIQIEVLYSKKEFRNRDGLFCHDLKIEYISLSLRAFNYLKKTGVNYISELINLDEIDINKSNGIGDTTINEIVSLKKRIISMLDNRIVNDKKYDNLSEKCLGVIDAIRTKKDINGAEIFDQMYEVFKAEAKGFESEFFVDELVYIKLARQNYISNILKDLVLQAIEKSGKGATTDQILSHIPKGFNVISVLKKILKDLVENKQVIYNDNLYRIKYVSIYDFIDTIKNETHKKIMLDRLFGKTLEEIGIENNLTRERIRQIIVKTFDKRPPVLEDEYVDIYINYYFEKEDFLLAFNVGEYVYNYLNICYSKGQKSIEECVEDDQLSDKEKEGIKKIVYKNYFLIGDEYVKSERSDICEYVIKTFAGDDITYEEFVQLYYSLIDDLGLENDERYSIAGRGYENKLVMSDYVLWKYGRKLRYYNMKSYDFKELLTSLNLEKYMNLEISTLLLLKNNSDLMNTYDIRDEYELHNLLKKVIKNSDSEIKFHRMPNIEIGNANRVKQVMDLLVLNAPIDNVELAKKYEEIYGVMANTVLANYFKEISIYLQNGIYKLDYPTPSEETIENIKNTLVADFYMIKDVKRILEIDFLDLDLKFINTYVLKKVGFRVYTNYIIKDSYQSAADYFRTLIIKDDLLDLKIIPAEIINIGLFQSELAQLKSEYEIIEYLPSKYINFSKLKTNNISKKDLIEYIDFVFNHVKDGEYFTVYSLMYAGIENELGDLGFGDIFYASILSECKSKFQFRRLGSGKLFMKGKQNVYVSNFIEYILLKSEMLSMDVYDLISILKDRYNVFFEKHKIIELVKGTSMHYDKIYDKIYLDYSIYYEEV